MCKTGVGFYGTVVMFSCMVMENFVEDFILYLKNEEIFLEGID